jgi:hypothetical protein
MLSHSKPDIRVRPDDGWAGNGWICEVWVRSFIDDAEVLLSADDRLIEEMHVWTLEQGGEQCSWNYFWFPTEEGATMFVLRWSDVV